MKTLLEAQLWIVEVGVWLAGLSFLLFFGFSIASFVLEFRKDLAAALKAAADAKAAEADKGEKALLAGTDVPALLTAASSLTDSLAKAGPALWAMIASILFLVIATCGSGAFSASESKPSAQAILSDTCKADKVKCKAELDKAIAAQAASSNSTVKKENLPVR